MSNILSKINYDGNELIVHDKRIDESKAVNIRTLGIVHDDDTVSGKDIAQAVSQYGVVYFPIGRYYVTSSITFHSGMITGEYCVTPEYSNGKLVTLHEECNSVLDFSKCKDNTAVTVKYGGKLSNIVVRRNDYLQGENLELARNGNLQPIYPVTNTNDKGVGVNVQKHSSKCENVCVCECGFTGFNIGAYATLHNCMVLMSQYAYNASDNDIQCSLLRAQHVSVGLNCTGSLGIFENLRFDEVARWGIYINKNSEYNIINDFNVDRAYYSAVVVNGSNNIISNGRYRCALAYPNITTAVDEDNYDKIGAISIGTGTAIPKFVTITNCQGSRNNIMDSGDPIYNMPHIINVYGGYISLHASINTDLTPIDVVHTVASPIADMYLNIGAYDFSVPSFNNNLKGGFFPLKSTTVTTRQFELKGDTTYEGTIDAPTNCTGITGIYISGINNKYLCPYYYRVNSNTNKIEYGVYNLSKSTALVTIEFTVLTRAISKLK